MIINSILDNDLYVFSVSYVFFKNFPDASGVMEFKDRNNTVYTPEFVEKLKEELKNLENLSLTNEEFFYLIHKIPYIPENYFEWFRGFRFDFSKFNIWLDEESHLHIAVEDKLYKAGFYEIPTLAIVSELTSMMNGYDVDMESMFERLDEKIELSNKEQLIFSEFGTRRRHSFEVHEEVIKRIKEKALYCSGTSNVYFAMKYDMTPIGTMNHFFIEFIGSQFGYNLANQIAMQVWSDTYRGSLGTFLTDTYTTKAFFNNLDKYHALLYDGVRQDSGDEFEFADKIINRYLELGVDPTKKLIVFSNALDFPKFLEIKKYCEGKIKAVAGIGTNLTHDTGYPHPNIVMKLILSRMNNKQKNRHCVKLSDDLGKHQGDPEEVELCKRTLEIYDDAS